ncbi:hypothetical protein HF673_14955 [Acidithiobacillus thiooxidans]|uniref:Uncharacterized protein n=3 Tax=Acidithiobacillus TaxID=119977 RepID=A0A1C2J1N7_ACITH|nr:MULTISPECIES: hypothetical protein [Acidithiobacillus]MBU2742272.1 hypothetical protein [Acidithiobacillus albertensis]MBU2758844.1 hypothetical protein [Acidithiobacillus sulfurivorans]MBU2837026.1 hypothetical protein [Acidithiobacillus thiooxidans]OCX68130.1 hypothetical protein A6M23_18985 [Acidithiobacillus thiooxidans]OCX82180.1 hypothetical protein A6P08_12595 [Acidithiobacillus thiooxidans]
MRLSLPTETASSERQALQWICRRLSLRLDFQGPDYALYGAGVPFGKPVPALELLRDLAVIPYIQGTMTVRLHSVKVHNAPLR